ncbi:MAG: hypothetical protein JNM52_01710, partial [Betaproteobacteria bacterium]|nr:hypothetical protein [Betaproteobacteria bacterium]
VVNEASTATREIDFPALDIVADSFTFKNRWLGKIELAATPLGANWRIDRLAISNGHAKLEMDGLWQRYGDPEQPPQPGPVQSRTVVNLKFESNNLNALFNQFGFGDQVARGTGKLEGKLIWPGQATQFQLAKLSGDFKVEGRKGQFAKIPPGAAGKLLSLLSLQAIGRRFVFDFRDVFSEGFAFDTIDGDVKVKNGIMTTTDFAIVGPAASVKMEGDISLPNESQSLLLTVVPTSVDTGVLLGVGLLANPVVGLTTYVAQKLFGNPVAQALSYQLSVAGTWDNPQVERVNRNASTNAGANAGTNAGKLAEPTKSAPKKL